MNWMQPMVSQPYPIEKYKPNMIGQTLPMPKTDFKETRFDLSPLAAFKSAFDTGITNFSARSKNSYQNSLQNFYRSQSPYENLNRGNYTTNQDLYGSTYMQQGGIADLDKQYQKYQDLAYVAQQEGDSEFVNEFLQPKMSKIETERKTLDDYFNEQRVQDEINQIRKSIPQYQDQQYIDPYQRTQIRHYDYNDNQSDEEPSYTSSFGVPSPKVGFNMYNRAKSLEGMGYQMGAKGQNNNIDCSGAVCKIVGAPTMTSEDLTTHGKNFRQYNGPDDLKEGTVIGFDFGPKKHDVGRKHGIDHTGVIVKNPQTNELEYKESVSGTGFRTLSLPAFLQKYPNRAKQIFVSNYLQQGGSFYNTLKSQNKPIIDNNTNIITSLLQQPQIDQIKKQEAINKQIANYDRTFSKTQSETPISKLKSKQLKASYVYNNPYSQLDEDGNIAPIANDRDLQGVPKFGTQAYRTDDGLKNIMHGLDAAMLVEGIGHLGYKGLRNLGEYVTTKTPLKNASEYNPWRFKANTESYYRGIGRSGYDDAVESGILRTGNKMANFGEDLYMTSNFDVAKGNYSVDKATYKGNPFGGADDYWEKILPKDTKSYIAEIPKNVLTNPREVGTGTGIMVNKGALPLDKIKFYKEHWLKGYKEIPKSKTNIYTGDFNREEASLALNKILKDQNQSSFLPNTQKEFIENRVNRLLQQDIPQNVRTKLLKALDNHSEIPAIQANLNANSLGVNRGNSTHIFSDAPLSDKGKGILSAHEVGHYYENSPSEAKEWLSHFNLPATREGRYLKGNPIYSGKGTTNNWLGINLGKGEMLAEGHANELRERSAQLKDYIQYKNNIRGNFKITESQLDDAIENYIPNTGVDNNMTNFFNSIKDKKGLLKTMNKYPLSIISATGLGVGALQQKQQGGIITDPMGQYNHPGKIINIPSNNITMQGIPYPVLGISNTGDSKLMQPNMNYKFKGKSVLEIPIFQKGGSKQGYVYDPSRMQAPPSFNRMAQTTYGITPVPAPVRQVPKMPAKQAIQPMQTQKKFVPMQPVIYPQAHSTYQEVTPVPNPFYVANEDFVLPQMSQTQFARTLSNINEKQQSRQNDFWMNPYLNYITSPNPLFNPLIKNLSRKDQILARLAQPKRKSNKLF